jgi:RNA polymerase sigma-70 factor (ECF subfamily)
MADDMSFAAFMQRIRAGDAQAAEELVRKYERSIRLEVRMRISDPRLYRLFDSMDVCQSVLASFFVRAAAGQYELDTPEQLLKLLVGIARNKVAFAARKQRARRRDYRRVEGVAAEDVEQAAPEPGPSRLAAGKELLQEFRQRLTAEERQMVDLRAQGQEWATIASQLGGTAQARRMQLSRAVERVSRELGIDEEAS